MDPKETKQYLDADGLNEFYQVTKKEVGETLVDQFGIIDVKIPVESILTQEEYDALSLEKKNKGLYVIEGETSENGQDNSRISYVVEEYDTTVEECAWHVRKFNNGYCELIGKKTYTGLNFDQAAGTALYVVPPNQILGNLSLPITLVTKLFENNTVALTNSTSGYGFFIGYSLDNGVNKTQTISPHRTTSLSNISLILRIYITGYWKTVQTNTIFMDSLTKEIADFSDAPTGM